MKDCTEYKEGTGEYLSCEYNNEVAMENVMPCIIGAALAILVLFVFFFSSNYRARKDQKVWEEYLQKCDQEDLDKK